MPDEPVLLKRDIKAVRIPEGSTALLSAGSKVWINHRLGDSFTVTLPAMGGLFRIEGADADALGLEPAATGSIGGEDEGLPLEDRVWARLKTCYDPEIPVNIVDLGLIYSMRLVDAGEGGKFKALVEMTLTAPGCGMGPAIAADAKRKIETLDEIAEASVDVVWNPPWGPERISPAGRKELGIDP